MDKDRQSIFYIVLALSFFLGATVQYSEGSNTTGMVLIIGAVILLARSGIGRASTVSAGFVRPRVVGALGVLIVSADLFYNLQGLGRGGINTLDTMVLLFGLSLVAFAIKNDGVRSLGSFGAVVSFTFIGLYLVFYQALNHQLYLFDHYFVMLPSAYLIRALGVPIEIVGTEVLRINGVSDLVVKIGGPCSGLYSMFLLIGIVAGYSATEGITKFQHILSLAAVAAVIAYLGNLFRVSVIYVAGYLYGSEAMMSVHVHLGWIIFAVTSLFMLFMLEKTKKGFFKV